MNRRSYALAALVVLVGVALWGLSLATYSAEPAQIEPAPIAAGKGVQATVQATTFDQSTLLLTIRLKLRGVGGLVDERGLLRSDLDLRVVDDEGVQKVSLTKGDPLESQEIAVEMDGSVGGYPFDRYTADFSFMVEEPRPDDTLAVIPLSIGTAKAETGWYTDYRIDSTSGPEAKITVVNMQREAFIISFAILLVALMLLLAGMSIAVGVLCVTNRRESDAGILGWQVAFLFALPFVRQVLPGNPPIGCLLDEAVFAWAMLLCVVAVLLSLVAWIRQSHATLIHSDG